MARISFLETGHVLKGERLYFGGCFQRMTQSSKKSVDPQNPTVQGEMTKPQTLKPKDHANMCICVQIYRTYEYSVTVYRHSFRLR